MPKRPTLRLVTIGLMHSSAVLLVLLLSRGGWPEEHVRLFASAIFGCSLSTFVLAGNTHTFRTVASGSSGLGWLAFYALFVDYQDRPWFAQAPPGGCDGPCFYWYTFEFDPPYGLLLIVLTGAIMCGWAITRAYNVADRRLTHRRN